MLGFRCPGGKRLVCSSGGVRGGGVIVWLDLLWYGLCVGMWGHFRGVVFWACVYGKRFLCDCVGEVLRMWGVCGVGF